MTYYDMRTPARKLLPAVVAGAALVLAGAFSIGGVHLFGNHFGFGFMPLLILSIWPRFANTLVSVFLVFGAGLFTDWATGGIVGQWALIFSSARLYQLQVLEAEDYLALSDNNRFNFNMLLPERGQIRDRYGVTLAKNSQNYRLVIIPERTKEIEKTLDNVSKISALSAGQRERIRKDVKQNPKFVPILVKENVDWETFSALNMRMHALPGIVSEVGQGRAYPENGVFSHVLGYIGRAGARDIENDDDPLLRQPTFRIGKTGIESSQEKTLRGEHSKWPSC